MIHRKRTFKSDNLGPRDNLLKTAITLFSARGYDGVSISNIVAQAGVSKRMVYHYFGSKTLLYQEALSYAYNELREKEQDAMRGITSLETAIKCLVRVYIYFPSEHPLYASLLRWVNISHGRGLENRAFPLTKDGVINPLK